MKPWQIGALVGFAAALVVLNIAALTVDQGTPWLTALDVFLDLAVLGAGVFLVVRLGLRSESQRLALGQVQARLEAVVDSAMDAIITVDAAQRVVLFNRAAEAIFRCRREDALGGTLERFIPARFRNLHHGHVEDFGRTGVTSRKMGDTTTLWALRADGAEFPIEASISQAGTDAGHFYTVILRDVTLRKQSEDQLRRQQDELRELSARVLEAREEEKTLIARELHDELGQLLTALKMDLSWLRARLPAGEAALAAKAGEMNALVDRTVISVRRISAELRPLMLDDLGLPDAVTWLTDDFAARSGVRVEARVQLEEAGEIARPIATTLYRVLQESLTNIARHSQAKLAWVTLDCDGPVLRLEVEDDGCGIDEASLAKSRSLGVKGMRERVRYLGGTLEIGHAPRGGTRVLVRLPAGDKAAA
ncbi:MAG: PAS domain-containing sensor histidine kinase [Betaproteobacteria bacterium]